MRKSPHSVKRDGKRDHRKVTQLRIERNTLLTCARCGTKWQAGLARVCSCGGELIKGEGAK